MTKITLSVQGTYLTLDGHAGAGPRGRDIVCAALSALAYTLGQAVDSNPDYGTDYRMDWNEASMSIICAPKDEAARERCRRLFAAFAVGFRLIAEAYPEYVSLEEFSVLTLLGE